MQILWPATAQELGIKRKSDLFNPCTNIRAGARYLKYLMDRYKGDYHLALAAYNYGPHRIKQGAAPFEIPKGAHKVIKTKLGDFMVAYPYVSENERQSTATLIEQCTGLRMKKN